LMALIWSSDSATFAAVSLCMGTNLLVSRVIYNAIGLLFHKY
jgi:hypothetical protein